MDVLLTGCSVWAPGTTEPLPLGYLCTFGPSVQLASDQFAEQFLRLSAQSLLPVTSCGVTTAVLLGSVCRV